MVENYLQQSPLAHLGLKARAASDNGSDAGVLMGERPLADQVGLRGEANAKFLAATEKALGLALPVDANTVNTKGRGKTLTSAIWMGPDEWLITTKPGGGEGMIKKLRKALAGIHSSVFDVSDSRTVIALSGLNARDVLMKGCGIDLHHRSFGPGQCASTTLGLAHVLIHQTGEDKKTGQPEYHLYVHRSFAEYMWAWLEDAAREYGIKVGAN